MRASDFRPRFRAEVSFVNRQRELQTLHRQLHTVLQDMNLVAPTIDKALGIDAPVEEEDAFELTCLNKTEISAEQEIRLLIREIQRLQDDVQIVQTRLIERTKGTRKTRVVAMVEQLSELYHVLEGQLYRAEKLIRLG
jgi:hypothetical protein